MYLDGTTVKYEAFSDGRRFTYMYDANGELYAVRLATYSNPTASAIYYYIYNLQGDVIALVNSANGQIVARYEYDAWGKPVAITDANGNAITDQSHIAHVNPFRYRGYYYDNETGLYYLNSRYYDPDTGRFINADGEIANIGGDILGYNQFVYCFNNHINMSDDNGEWPSWGTILKAAAIVVIAAAVVTAVAVTVSTFGAGSVAGVAVISSALSIAAKATEVAVLQAKKSINDRKSSSTLNNGKHSTKGNKSGEVGNSKENSGGQVAADVIDAVFDNGVKILSPSATKTVTTGASFVIDDLFNNPVLNSSFTRFVKRSASTFGTATAYGFTAYAWIQTTISIFSDDPVQRAEQRGYKLK